MHILEFFRKPLVGYAILVVGLLLAVYVYTSAVDDNLRDGLRSSCERVNVLRAQSNLSDVVQWTILSNAAARERELAKKDAPETREAHRKSAETLAAQAQNLTVTGLTDCKAALDRPDTYKIPTAQPIGNIDGPQIYPHVQRTIDDSRSTLQAEVTPPQP